MNKPVVHGVAQAADGIQSQLTDYACALGHEALSAEAVHAAKVRIIGTLGAPMGGFNVEDYVDARRTGETLGKLRALESLPYVAVIPPAFLFAGAGATTASRPSRRRS